MPTYRRQQLTGLGHDPPRPDADQLTGLRPMLRGCAEEVMRGQDKVAALSRRIVASSGARDSPWRAPDTTTTTGTQAYPDAATWYVVARGRIEVTPGCCYRVTGACVPSGATQYLVGGGGGYLSAGIQGHVRLTVTWTDRNSTTETTVREIDLPNSTLQYGAADTTPGGLWRTLSNFEIDLVYPPGATTDVVELRRFSQHVTADVVLEVRGSPRIVDVVVHEIPFAVAFEQSDAADRWTSHTFAAGDPDAPGVPQKFPMLQSSSTNSTGGTGRVLDTARAHGLRLGPCLLSWTAYNEDDATPTSTITPVTTNNDGTTYESIVNPSHAGTGPAAYDADLPGWSVSCGGYARRWASNNSLVLYDRIAAIPVIVRAYGRGVTAGTSTVRVQTALHSYVDVVLPVSASSAWSRSYGWLEVGINPDQPTVAQIFVNHLGGVGSLRLEAVEVYFNASTAVV